MYHCNKCYGIIDHEIDRILITPCNHVFHLSCLVKAFEMMSYCQSCGNKGTYIYADPYSVFIRSATDRIKKIEVTRMSSENRLKMLLRITDDIIDSSFEEEIIGLDVLKLKLLEKIDHAVRRKRHRLFEKDEVIRELEKRRNIISRMGLYDIAE